MVHDESAVSPETTLLHTPLYTRARAVMRWQSRGQAHQRVVETRLLVGTAPSVNLVLEDRTVSRLHAELTPESDGLWIRDLGSRNGTFVNSVRVQHARVPDDAVVRIGSTEIHVQYDEAPDEVAIWPNDRFGPLIGGSYRMRELYAMLDRVAKSDAPVFVRGETGTGKELVARAIHEASPRRDKPLVTVDCAALPENLLESELFGHARGAFTGAAASREGALEAAQGGTIFLDEIGELPISMQPKLLRVLESRAVRRIGETSYRPIDVRFVCATHRDLASMVVAREFREDLYFRLAVLPVHVPALRERPDDIAALVSHFLARHGETSQDDELLRALSGHAWPGNVRQLRNFVEQLRALGKTAALRLLRSTDAAAPVVEADEPAARASVAPPAPEPNDGSAGGMSLEHALSDEELFALPYREFRDTWHDVGEREYLVRLLSRHDQNIPAAAREVGVDRTYIYRLAKRHGLVGQR